MMAAAVKIDHRCAGAACDRKGNDRRQKIGRVYTRQDAQQIVAQISGWRSAVHHDRLAKFGLAAQHLKNTEGRERGHHTDNGADTGTVTPLGQRIKNQGGGQEHPRNYRCRGHCDQPARRRHRLGRVAAQTFGGRHPLPAKPWGQPIAAPSEQQQHDHHRQETPERGIGVAHRRARQRTNRKQGRRKEKSLGPPLASCFKEHALAAIRHAGFPQSDENSTGRSKFNFLRIDTESPTSPGVDPAEMDRIALAA
jgi:hypothetical protein